MSSTFAERVLPLAALTLASLVCTSLAHAEVCHEGVVSDGEIRWRTVLFGDASLLEPLPDDVALESIEGGTARVESGRLVGVDAELVPTVVRTRQSIEGADVVLHPPLVEGSARIVVTGVGEDRVDFAPAIDGPIERRVGHHASRSVGDAERAALDRLCGSPGRSRPTFVRGVRYDDLRGALVRAEDRRGFVLSLAAVLAIVFVVGAMIAYRRLGARARIEHAEAVIDERFRELERTAADRPTR
jgi:hypothetical protein